MRMAKRTIGSYAPRGDLFCSMGDVNITLPRPFRKQPNKLIIFFLFVFSIRFVIKPQLTLSLP